MVKGAETLYLMARSVAPVEHEKRTFLTGRGIERAGCQNVKKISEGLDENISSATKGESAVNISEEETRGGLLAVGRLLAVVRQRHVKLSS